MYLFSNSGFLLSRAGADLITLEIVECFISSLPVITAKSQIHVLKHKEEKVRKKIDLNFP